MINRSFWEADLLATPTDIIIIGAGITGLSAALSIKEARPDLSVAILERSEAARGASTRNAGFATFGSVSELAEDIDLTSAEMVAATVKMRWQGLQLLRSRVSDVEMNFIQEGGYEIFFKRDEYEQAEARLQEVNEVIADSVEHDAAFQVSPHKASDHFVKAHQQMLVTPLEGKIHPARMLAKLRQRVYQAGVMIHFGIEIEQINAHDRGVELRSTMQDILNCRQVLVATNGFSKQLLPELEIRPVRNQVIVTEPLQNCPPIGNIHADRGYYYARTIGDRILLGGGRPFGGTDEETNQFGLTKKLQSHLLDFLEQRFTLDTKPRIAHQWSGILGVGPAKEPIIKTVQPNVTCAVRLAGIGVAIGSIVGHQAAEHLLQQMN